MDFRTGAVNWKTQGVAHAALRSPIVDNNKRASAESSSGVNRLLSAAVVNRDFCRLLLSDPEWALRSGYRGEIFDLSDDDVSLVCSIKASSLRDFASDLWDHIQNPYSGDALREVFVHEKARESLRPERT